MQQDQQENDGANVNGVEENVDATTPDNTTERNELTSARTTPIRIQPSTNTDNRRSTVVSRHSRCARIFKAIKNGCKLEFIFYKIGKLVGAHPVIMLIMSLVMCGTTGMGMIFWREELNDLELFMPPASPVRDDAAWVEQHFRDDLRYESVIVIADNVMAPEVLLAISELDTDIRNINVSGEHTWEDVCARYLTWFQGEGDASLLDDNEIREIFEDRPDFSANFNNDCIYQTLLRLWTVNDSIQNLTQEEVLDKFTVALNGSANDLTIFQNVRPLLAGVEYDANGNLLGAKATLLNYMLTKANKYSADWELEFIEQAIRVNRSLPPGMKIYAVTDRSYNDVLQEVLNSNMITLFSGFALIIFYVILMMGRFNRIEQRIYLSLLGVSIVGQSILASYGFCFYTGFFYGPIHPILPFLLLGIGVDDMFVIVQSLDNLTVTEKQMAVAERIGRTLKYAGASITVTSLTDIVAFAVGTTTVMPSLKSFCFFAAMGIFFLYVFVVTFFVSCVAVDEYRIQSKRDGCVCIQHINWKPNACSQKDFQKIFFRKMFAPILLKPPVKMIVIVVTLLLLAFNIWCCFQVEQKFDPIWYLNPDSYPMQYAEALKLHFPKHGKRAAIYIGEIDYFAERENLEQLMYNLELNPFINKEAINFWYNDFQKWLNLVNHEPESEEEFRGYLTEYLFFTKEGLAFMKDIKFSGFPFGDYNITASQIPIQHIMMNTTAEQVQAMQSVRDLVKSINITSGDTRMVAYSSEYISWTANKVIGEELTRNLALTIGAVAIVTIVLIRNIQTSIWVICCVCFTLVDLVGSMYLFGLTIEISTSIVIILCVGLAVDYSAHIGHKFTTLQGTRDERAKETLILIGPAVLNGGISTFLAFVMLSNSDSYIFTTFFKLFFSVVIYGLFHGLFFLPVILSILGPNSSKNRDSWHEKLYTVPVENHNGFIPTENNTSMRDQTDVELHMIGTTSNNHQQECSDCTQDQNASSSDNVVPKKKQNNKCEVKNGCKVNHCNVESQETTLLPSNNTYIETAVE